MAKSFPFFKFVATEWLTGDIVYESFEAQGLFINICALYWQRDGKLSLEDVRKRYKTNLIDELIDRFLIIKNGLISIKFLDEQLIEAGHVSKTNSENGKKGAEAKRIKATAKRPLSDPQAKLSKEEQEEEEEEEEEQEIEKEEELNTLAEKNNFSAESLKTKKEKKEPHPYYQILKTDFEKWFLYIKKFDYYFQGAKDAKALNQIIKKIEFYMKKNPDSVDIQENFRIIIKSISDPWIIDNFNLATINSKFNDSLSQLKNGKSKKPDHTATVNAERKAFTNAIRDSFNQ
jgi:hypothetical protein